MGWVKSVFKTLAERQATIPGAMYELDRYEDMETPLPRIANLNELASALTERLVGKRKIVLFGDYDVDGIMSIIIMMKALRFLGRFAESVSGKPASVVSIDVPDRETEGYGFSVSHAEKLHDCVVLLLDNGIVQYEAIQMAKDNNCEVYVVDHHQPGSTLPGADIIVNPHAIAGGEFDNYCAAGLSYRLARAMFCEKWVASVVPSWAVAEAMHEFLFMAALATVADIVPMLYENRVIVKEGMKSIPDHWKTICYCLMDSEKPSLNEGDIAYKIAPAINAVGRLGELNAAFIEELATAKDTEPIGARLQVLNNERKNLTREVLRNLKITRPEDKVIVVQDNCIPGGIAGIVAGHLVEKYEKPVFVFGPVADGQITGSARSCNGIVHLKNILDKLDVIAPGMLVRYGGHESAAGVTIPFERLSEFTDIINSLTEYAPVKEKVYDFDLVNPDDPEGKPYDLFDVYDGTRKFAPYGEGNPAPILRYVANVSTKDIRFMGTGKEHLKLTLGNYEAVAFNMANKVDSKNPSFELYGTLQLNEFRGSCRVQLNVVDFDQPEPEKKDEPAEPATDFAKELMSSLCG